MQSELELDETVRELSIIATNPTLYRSFIELESFTSLVSLLTHENTDIALDVVDVLFELFDLNLLNDNAGDLTLLAAQFVTFPYFFHP